MADVDNRLPVFVKAVWRDGTKWVAGHIDRNRGQHAEAILKEQFPGRADFVDDLTHLKSVPQPGVGGHKSIPSSRLHPLSQIQTQAASDQEQSTNLRRFFAGVIPADVFFLNDAFPKGHSWIPAQYC